MSQLLKSYVKPASVLLNKYVLSSYLEKYTLGRPSLNADFLAPQGSTLELGDPVKLESPPNPSPPPSLP